MPFREGFIFTKLRICEVTQKSPRENFGIYSIITSSYKYRARYIAFSFLKIEEPSGMRIISEWLSAGA